MPGTTLQEHAGNEKSWVWTAVDFADETQKIEMFAMRFSSAESELLFKIQSLVSCCGSSMFGVLYKLPVFGGDAPNRTGSRNLFTDSIPIQVPHFLQLALDVFGHVIILEICAGLTFTLGICGCRWGRQTTFHFFSSTT